MNPYDDLDTVDELPAPPRKTIDQADRELLELAARALGARFEEVDGEGYGNLHFEDGATTYAWNPLVHSDDAFNLMVKLGIPIDPDGIQYAYSLSHARSGETMQEAHGDNPAAATRRLITRAAAEIGKAMAK